MFSVLLVCSVLSFAQTITEQFLVKGNCNMCKERIEKTVVDIVFYRERIGIEETKEVLINYLHRSDRNLNRLIRYAEMLKCGDVMKKYLEVLV